MVNLMPPTARKMHRTLSLHYCEVYLHSSRLYLLLWSSPHLLLVMYLAATDKGVAGTAGSFGEAYQGNQLFRLPASCTSPDSADHLLPMMML
jgi:hypothetical protein